MNKPDPLNAARPQATEEMGSAQRTFVYSPALDIHETPEGLVLEADLPGVSAEHLQLQVQNNVLQIYGKVEWPIPNDTRTLHAEIEHADFYRSFILSEEVDTEKIEADFKNGVLTLFLPKAEKSKPRKIEIRSHR